MIIKRWNGSAFVEEHPKTKTTLLYANDGTTTVFDANQKIKPVFLPDSVFGGLKFATTLDLSTNDKTLPQLKTILEGASYVNASLGEANKGMFLGYYFIVSVAGSLRLSVNSDSSEGVWDAGLYTYDDGTPVDEYTQEVIYLEPGDWVVVTGVDIAQAQLQFSIVNNTYNAATATAPGVVKLGSATVQATAPNSVTSTASRSYAIQSNGSGQLVVNVPWVDTNTTYGVATATVAGLIELFSDTQQSVAANAVSATASRTYGIQLNAAGQAVVNVPWTDTNTTYGLATTGTSGLVRLGVAAAAATVQGATTTAGRFYHIGATTAGNMYVNVPWTDTTYSAATSTVAGLIELGSDTVQSVAANAVTTTASRTYALQVNAAGQGVVNVPWSDTNTTYAKATSTVLGLVELFSDTVQSVAANSVTTTASRTYGVQLDSSDRMVVNVPWTDNNTTYSAGNGISLSTTTFSVAGGEGLTQEASGLRMTYPMYSQTATPTTSVTGTIWFDVN